MNWIKLYEGKPTVKGNYEVKVVDIDKPDRIAIGNWNGYKFEIDNRVSHTEYVDGWRGEVL